MLIRQKAHEEKKSTQHTLTGNSSALIKQNVLLSTIWQLTKEQQKAHPTR